MILQDKVNDEMHITWITVVIYNCNDHKNIIL